MYIREYITTNKKTGTKYVTHRLVESYQTEKGPRQRIIMHLGTLTLPKTEWRKLALALEARLAGQTSLFQDDPEIEKAADLAMEHYEFNKIKKEDKLTRLHNQDLITVDLNNVSTTESRSLGPELVAHAMWEQLGFDAILKSCGFTSYQKALAKAVIIARLISPSSDIETWRWLKNRTALLELLSEDLSNVGKDAIYEIADAIFLNKETIENALRDREARLFPSETTLFLYDLTNTYFEGRCINNELAKRGKSKEHRSDCPLVTLALVVDAYGFPIFSQIYSGNQSEPQTLEEILNKLYDQEQNLFSHLRPTIVMDRGIATKDNINLLKKQGYPYIVIERRATEKDYIKEFEQAKESFAKIDNSFSNSEWLKISSNGSLSESVYVKKIIAEDSCRVLCISEGRERKEVAIDSLKEERFIQDLSRLQGSVRKGNILMVDKVSERIGRLRERYPSIAPHYNIILECDSEQKKVMDITYEKKPTRTERSVLTGCYVIETSHRELTAEEIWQLYTTLTRVEESFRVLKTNLGVRPVYHQLAKRTKAHLFISVLAYHLLICIERTLRNNGDSRRWSTICTELSTHQRTTVILVDEKDMIHHIRVSGTQEKVHKDIYSLLNVKDPLKRKHHVVGARL